MSGHRCQPRFIIYEDSKKESCLKDFDCLFIKIFQKYDQRELLDVIGLINYTLRSERISASDQNLSNKLLDRFCFHFGNQKENYGSDRQFRVITALLYFLDQNEVLKAGENLHFLEQVVTKICLHASLGRPLDDIVKITHTLKLKLGMEHGG